jgi:Lrp/AsnC family transcriptional regulator
MNLDDVDRRILRELQRDCSRVTAEIAEAAGLSQAACWRRIHRFKVEGYILQHTALLDRRKLGLSTQVFAQIKLSATGRANVTSFAEAVQSFPEVLECYVLMGSADFLLRIATASIDAYERFFFDHLSKIPGVQDINSIVALSEIKRFTGLPV